MSTISATQRFALSVVETFSEEEMPATGNRSFSNDQFNLTQKLNATSTPPGAKTWAEELTGDQSPDFTALARAFGAAVDASGLKLQMLLVNNLSESATLVVAKGSSNGYAINGAAGDFTVPPGGSVQYFFNDALTDVDGTHKTIDCTITAGQSYQLQLVFG